FGDAVVAGDAVAVLPGVAVEGDVAADQAQVQGDEGVPAQLPHRDAGRTGGAVVAARAQRVGAEVVRQVGAPAQFGAAVGVGEGIAERAAGMGDQVPTHAV